MSNPISDDSDHNANERESLLWHSVTDVSPEQKVMRWAATILSDSAEMKTCNTRGGGKKRELDKVGITSRL